jgi:outer membrane protein assembly factor BamA
MPNKISTRCYGDPEISVPVLVTSLRMTSTAMSAGKKLPGKTRQFDSIHRLCHRSTRSALFNFNLLLVLNVFVVSGFFHNAVLANEHLLGKPISEIRIHGNHKTRSDVVISWAEFKVGQVLSQEMLNHARQNILDTDLFKQVLIELESETDRLIVNIWLEEKYFTLLLPRLSRNADGDVKVGLRLRKHNINGADQTLKVLVEKADLSTGDTGRRYRIKYDFPQVSKPYDYRITLGESTANTDDDGFLNVVYEDYFSLSIVRDWYSSFFALPLTLTTSATYQKIDLREPYPVALDELVAGHFNRLSLQLEYDDVHNEEYRRYGRYYSLEYQQGLDSLNSDFASNITEFEARYYYRLGESDNFNSRLFTGYAHDAPFSHPYYEIGGASNIRGLDKESFSGNVMVFANLEYIKGFAKYPSFRGSLFLDIGNVYDDLNEIDLSDLHTSIGIGLRWKATSFVNTDLFIDLAYNTDTGENKVYGGTSLNF